MLILSKCFFGRSRRRSSRRCVFFCLSTTKICQCCSKSLIKSANYYYWAFNNSQVANKYFNLITFRTGFVWTFWRCMIKTTTYSTSFTMFAKIDILKINIHDWKICYLSLLKSIFSKLISMIEKYAIWVGNVKVIK